MPENKNPDDKLDFIQFEEVGDSMDKHAQILQNMDYSGELSNPLTHLQNYDSIADAQKARLKVRKKILDMFLNTREDRYVAKQTKVKGNGKKKSSR